MSDEIIQHFGIDANQAFTTLDKLDKSFANLEKRLKSSAESLRNFNNAGAKNDTMLRSMQQLGDSSKHVERLTVSWEYLTSRILYTQTVVSFFGAFRRELSESVKTAEEFQRKIAEITTISDFSQAGAGSTVKNLSDQFNVPMLEEAAGLYQVLSNGITKAAEATNFLAEANKFARATNSDTKNSVDLLSGAVKGFGLSTDQTSQAAGVLFEAIRAGRITASELGNSFGRVGPRAAELGLTLEETAGALAAITVKGVKTSEAITQLGGILTALTKPTDAMTEALRKMGFSTAEEALAALRLPGLLEAISKSTNGTSAALAKMFPNVRGIAGELALTGQGLKEFVANVRSMEGIGSNLSTSKYFQATATDAEKVTKEFNKLSNALTVGFGQSVLKAGANLAQLTGGANTLIAAGKVLVPLAESAGIAVAVMGAKALVTSSKLRTMVGSVDLLSKSILAIGAAATVGDAIGTGISNWSTSAIESTTRANQRVIDQLKKTQADAQRTAEQLDQARVQSALRATAQLNQNYQSQVSHLRTVDSQMATILSGSINSVVSAREKAVNELKHTIDSTEKLVESSQNRVSSLLGDKEDRDFESDISQYDDRQKGMWRSDRALDMADQASLAMGKAQTPEEINKALNKWSKARSEAEKSGNTDTLDRITQQQIEAEKKLQTAIKDRKPELEATLAIRQQELDLLREQAKVVKESLSFFGKNGLLSDEDLKERRAKLNEALGGMPVKIKLDAQESIDFIKSQLTNLFTDYKKSLPVDTSDLERLTGKPITSGFDVTSGMTNMAKQAADLRKQQDEYDAAQKRISQLRSEISQINSEVSGSFGRNLFRGADQPLGKDFERVSRKDKITDEDYRRLYDRVGQKNESWNPATMLDVESLSRSLIKLKEIKQLQEKVPADNTKLQETDQFLGKLPIDQAAVDVPTFSATTLQVKTLQLQQQQQTLKDNPLLDKQAKPEDLQFKARDSRGDKSSEGDWTPQLGSSQESSTTNNNSTSSNVTIGDIHVHGGDTSQQTIRQIMTGIQREMRRG